MALVGFLDGRGVGDVVPQADAAVEVEGEHVAAVGGEADVGDGRVVFVEEEEGAEALAGGGVPYAAGERLAFWLCVYTPVYMEKGGEMQTRG